MVLPGHLGGGYLAAKAVLTLFAPAFGGVETNALLAIGALAGELPDIDLIFYYFSRNKSRMHDHRDFITHAPLFWFCVSALIFLAGSLWSSAFTKYLGTVILCGTWSHFFLDSIEYGVRWLYPFSKKRYAFKKTIPREHVTASAGTFSAYWQFITSAYLKTSSFLVEILVTIIAILVLIYF